MTRKPTRIILIAGIFVLAILLMILLFPRMQAQADAKSMVGSWDTQITVVKQNATIPGYMTFFRDGNLLTDENPSPLETSGHGSWERTGPNQAAFNFHFIVGSTDPAADYITFLGAVTGTALYDPKTDTWSGPFKITGTDSKGNIFLDDTGTMSGKRIAAQP